MSEPTKRLADVAHDRHGAFTTDDYARTGGRDPVLRSWVKTGAMERVGVRTYRAATDVVDPMSDLAVIVADVRPELWFSHDTAAALIGLDGFTLEPPYHAVVRRGTLFTRPNAKVHTSIRLEQPDLWSARGFPVTSVVRTIIDLAPHLSASRLTAVVDGALRDRLTTETRLYRRIEEIRTQGRPATPKLLDVLDGAEPSRGGHSWLERRFLEAAAEAGLPRPVTQQVVASRGRRSIRVDCRYPGTPVVVELLGHRWHRSRDQMQHDAERMNRMLLDGLLPFQLTYDDLALRAEAAVATIREALTPFL